MLQNEELRLLGTTLVVVATSVTSRGKHKANLLVPAGEGGLREDSVILGHTIYALPNGSFIEKLGTLSEQRLSEIEIRVLYALGIPV